MKRIQIPKDKFNRKGDKLEIDSHTEQEKLRKKKLRDEILKHNIFVSKPASEFIKEARELPDPKPLYRNIWHEGEIGLLVGDTNTGKSLKAILIAIKIALHQVVIYADFELTSKVFQLRSTNKGSNTSFNYPDNFIRLEFADWNNIPEGYNEIEWIIETLKVHMEKHKCKVLIVDNITYLGGKVEDAKDATPLFKALKEWQRESGMSLLILAHLRKRKPCSPISIDDLLGSSRQMNFTDSAFGIGESKIDKNWRYIKQLKARLTEKTYGANNVILYELTPKENGLIDLVFKDYSTEHEHTEDQIPRSQEMETNRWKEAWEQRQLKDKLGNPSSYSSIGELFGYSHVTAMSYVKQYQAILDKEKEEKSKYKL